MFDVTAETGQQNVLVIANETVLGLPLLGFGLILAAVLALASAIGDDNTSNLLATVMMQYMGKPGWVKYWISEVMRAPKYLFAPVVFKRLFKDGWKLLRLRSSN